MIEEEGKEKDESLFTQEHFQTLVDADPLTLIQALEGNFPLHLTADTLSFEDFLFLFNAYKK